MKHALSLVLLCSVLVLALLLTACKREADMQTCEHSGAQQETVCEDATFDYHCPDCGETVSVTLQGVGHDFSVDFVVDKAPTEHNDGQKSRHCSRCAEKTDVTVLEKTNGFTFELAGVLYNEPLREAYYVLTKYSGTATEVYIPATYRGLPVLEIAGWAFKDNATMQGVMIPDGIEIIGQHAFENCTALKTLTLPGSVKAPDMYAFAGCTALESVTLSEGVELLMHNLFEGCTALKGIEFPASVKAIYYDCFANCTSLTSVVIPNTVEQIYGPFAGCTSLAELVVPFVGIDVENESDWGLNLALFDQQGVPESLQKVTVMGGKIARSAFFGLTGLTEVILGDGITTVEFQAFANCTSLKNVEIKSKQAVVADGAFWGCTGMETLTMPMSEITLSDIFACITSDDFVPLKKVVITGGTAVTESFFVRCPALTEVILPETVTTIGGHAFFYCTALQTVNLPAAVTTIDERAFYACTALREITLPAGLAEIGESAFYESGLVSIYIPSGAIGEYAFGYCKSLTALTTGANVTTIGVGAFSQTTALTRVELAEGLLYIRDHAFSWSGITELTVPSSVRTMGRYMLQRCTQLVSLTVPYLGGRRAVTVNELGTNGTLSYYFDSAAPALRTVTVTEGNLNQKTNGDEWIAICNDAFRGWGELTTINLPADLQYIGHNAFLACNAITAITIPDSVFYIGTYAFNSAGITSIRLPSGIYRSVDVLDGYNGHNVIAPNAFSNCTELVEIIFSTVPTMVGAEAFAHNWTITKVTVPNNVSLGVGVFHNCKNIAEISVPRIVDRHFSVLFASKSDFDRMDDWVTDGYAWWRSDTLCFNIPEALKTVHLTNADDISEYAFGYCDGIEKIVIDGGVETVDDYAFTGCTSLKTLVLPNSVVYIRDCAFEDCAALESLTFGAGMQYVFDLFTDTESLKHVYFYGTEAQWNTIFFSAEWDEETDDYLTSATIHYLG